MAGGSEYLEWDSNFFNLKIAKLEGSGLSRDLLVELEDSYTDKIDLIYYYSEEPLPENFFSNFYEVILVDTKVPIIREVVQKGKNPKISSYTNKKANKELLKLAKLAGQHTRFKIDPNISEEKYNKLFELWIEKSVTGELATTVLVYEIDNIIVGFGTVLIEGEIGRAPLLAVNRNYEGRGISFALMDAMESYMFENGCKFAVSSTQATNKKALKIYERYGIKFEKKIFVYHFWNKDRSNFKLNS